MRNAKMPVSIRLSEDSVKELKGLSKRHGVSQADIVAILVHCAYVSGGVEEEQFEEYIEIAKRS